MIPTVERYILKNCHIPISLLAKENLGDIQLTSESLALIDIEINLGKIIQIKPASLEDEDLVKIDLRHSIVLPCFVDVHTHLDKGHIWERAPNLDGTFDNALITVKQDATFWDEEDVYRRMEFALKCSYAHGTKAIRTHIDSFGAQAKISLNAYTKLQQEWANKLIVQAVSLVSLDYYQTEAGVILADLIAEVEGVLGGVAYMHPDLERQLDTVFTLAKERNLDLDFHADENGQANSLCLEKIARAALRNNFSGKINCGHCCSLAVQTQVNLEKILKLVKQTQISIVSLPTCNLYLQDRHPEKTPFWRGITSIKEIKKLEIPIAFASDNCRDPFYAFGDHDVLEIFTQAVRIAHLDTPYSNWIDSVTKTPAEIMGLSNLGRIAVDLSADLIIFPARYFSELLSRPQHDRLVIRQGKAIDTTLPKYEELDLYI